MMFLGFLVALIPVLGQIWFGVSYCDRFFWGWAWLLIAPWSVTALPEASYQ